MEDRKISTEKIEKGAASDGLEREIYRACLKQVVEFLNTTLPPISDSEDSEKVSKASSKKNKIESTKETTESSGTVEAAGSVKKISVRNGREKNDRLSYSLRSVTPTREKKSIKVEAPKLGAERKKRVNSFSERKNNDKKANRQLHKKESSRK